MNNQRFSAKHIVKYNALIPVPKKLKPSFSQLGNEKIALITMVKDEEDIIFENLTWHFNLGFRKFIILDNNSSDNTAKIISKFTELTKKHAKVFIIQDPIVEYIQSKKMTAAYKFAQTIWPELEWIFPVDADEFFVPEYELSRILDKVDNKYDALIVNCAKHKPNKDFYKFDSKLPFYEKIPLREKQFDNHLGKVIVRANLKNVIIDQGNHLIDINFSNRFPRKVTKALNFFWHYKYASGNALGLHMTEFPMRSVEQAHKKLLNGSIANISAQNLGHIGQNQGVHWSSYKNDMEKYGNNAAKKRFEEFFIKEDESINDPLPIKKSLEYFNEIIKQ